MGGGIGSPMYATLGWIRVHPPQVPINTATATNSVIYVPRRVESNAEAAARTIPFARAVPMTMTTTPSPTQPKYNDNNNSKDGVDDGCGSGTNDALPARSIKCRKFVRIGLVSFGLVAVSVIISVVVMMVGFNRDDNVPTTSTDATTPIITTSVSVQNPRIISSLICLPPTTISASRSFAFFFLWLTYSPPPPGRCVVELEATGYVNRRFCQ